MYQFVQEPSPGECVVKFVGDTIRFGLKVANGGPWPEGWRAFLRTNLGRATALREEILAEVELGRPPIVKSWHDIPMRRTGTVWEVELPLAEVGYFRAKAYAVDVRGWQYWPEGPDVGINVQPNSCRTWNTIYCAFPRMFGPTKSAPRSTDQSLEERIRQLDAAGYAVIPPSGKLRDLVRELPHIIEKLGCRIVHLLPVNPVPTTYARFGRFGSPYAAGDLLAIDPALVEFDRRTTGVDQFRELTRAVHSFGGWVFLDMAINHTGWESTLHWQHPEWFRRREDGTFVSPGAWGVIWEDLVELRHADPELRRYLADVFLEWCRRGVDGFRCDAGYFVPRDVWRYIIAKVRREFPDTVFLLEGLGGAWEITADLLTEGGFQWAYSELFQNYDGLQVSGYLDHAIKQSQRVGLLVHYSETHDNPRLAARGRAWSLLRNRLCALTSVSGCFGFTCGVEWLAKEKIDVHGNSSMAWGNPDNIVEELGRLNRLLAEHPCFFDGAVLERLSKPGSPVYALKRTSRDGSDAVLVLVNLHTEQDQTIELGIREIAPAGFEVDLLGQPPPISAVEVHRVAFKLPPASAYCLAGVSSPRGPKGDVYRRRCSARALALNVLTKHVTPEEINPAELELLANWVERDLAGFLSSATYLEEKTRSVKAIVDRHAAGAAVDSQSPESLIERLEAARGAYPRVVLWDTTDRTRVTPVPASHWLLIEHPDQFDVTLEMQGAGIRWHARSEQIGNRHVACYPPNKTAGVAKLTFECYRHRPSEIRAEIVFLDTAVDVLPFQLRFPENRGILLTNGRGAMARLRVDLGSVRSKYDCLLGANLNPDHAVERHVLAKRARVWVNADGFLSPLDARHLVNFDAGPPARWSFDAPAGDGRVVGVIVEANMLRGRNTTVLKFSRASVDGLGKTLVSPHPAAQERSPSVRDVRLTVRIDIEDRNFHHETFRTPGADHHFAAHCQTIGGRGEGAPETLVGFRFSPAPDRNLRVWATRLGTKEKSHTPTPSPDRTTITLYHHQPEWCEHIQHPIEATRGLTAEGAAYS
ncbi:MAG: glycogen debranching enzyme N-terminal domain-containing protein, partial [Verrucomicrobiae bacterium]|nr:glycogen debranching enzyme N-terminal domain-containing protein [Verrucomicrobiae bacterium]